MTANPQQHIVSRVATPTFGSLFSGIGGLDLGFDRAGFKCVWQVEINKFARKVLETHWPEVPRHDDIRTFQPTHADVIVGGFPCQDISQAGKRVGIDGERSGLWSEYVRVIREVRPRVVVVENVSALLIRGIGRVLGDLAGLGYDAEWNVIPASIFGSPQLRKRVFVVAYAERIGLDACAILDTGDLQKIVKSWSAIPLDRLCEASRFESDSNGAFVRVGDGISNPVDAIRGLGNAVVPQVAEWIAKRIIENPSIL